MKRIALLLFLAVAFPAVVNAQVISGGELGRVMAGPNAERYFRQAYAPVDYALGQVGQYAGYGYGRTGAIATGAVTGMAAGAGLGAAIGHNTRSALIGAGAGAAAGGLITYFATRPRGGQGYYTPDGQQAIFAQSGAQKPLDCRKPAGKRGKNEAACAAAEAEAVERQQAAERQACLTGLAASSWRLRNGSDRFTSYPTVDGQPLMVCGEPVVLRPLQTIRIFPPNGQIGGYSFGAGASGEKVEFEVKVQALNRPGFIGFVLLAPGAPEERN